MTPRLRRLRQLAAPNRTLIAGLALLVAGVACWVFAPAEGTTAEAGSAVSRVLSAAIQLAQRVVLWGDTAVAETQPRFNTVVVAVFLDELTPGQRKTLEAVFGIARAIVRDLFSAPGLLTIAALVAGYLVLASFFDARFGGAAAEPPEPTEGG